MGTQKYSMRRFFLAPKTSVKTDWSENIYNFTLKILVYLNLRLNESTLMKCKLNNWIDGKSEVYILYKQPMVIQGCGNTMPDLSDLVPVHSGQVRNFNLLVLS